MPRVSKSKGLFSDRELEGVVTAAAAKKAMPDRSESYYRDRKALLLQQAREIQARRARMR